MDRKIVGLAALAAAGLASACCIGPLVVTALGLGSLGLAASLVEYRPLFLALTGAILAVSFYLAYRRRPVDCADGNCELRSGSRTMKAGVWAMAALASALATFPSWSGRLASRAPDAVPVGAKVLSLNVTGMDCAACTVSIERSVEKVPGVRSADIDFDARRARIVADAGVDPKAIVAAVASAGYKAELLDGGGHE